MTCLKKMLPAVIVCLLPAGIFAQTAITVTAYRKAHTIHIRWTSSCEQSCKEYEIEGSAGDHTWEKIGTVNSSVADGHSDTVLSYAFSVADTAAPLAGIAFLFLLLLIPNASGKKTRWLLALFLATGYAACSRKIMDTLDVHERIRYIRLVQYDTEGHITSANVVKVSEQ